MRQQLQRRQASTRQQQQQPQNQQPPTLESDSEDSELLALIRPSLLTALPVVLKHSAVTMSDVAQRSVEIYDFSPELQTKDIRNELRSFVGEIAEFKWVDDTHAIAIFMDADAAARAVAAKADDPAATVRLRPMSQATKQSRSILKQLIDSSLTSWLPPKPRPKTSTVVARRMLGSALGIKLKRPETQ
jgi:hypothetical protein